MKTYGGVYLQLYTFFPLILRGWDWSASSSARFILGKRVFGALSIAGWVHSKFALDAVVKRKHYHCRGSNSTHQVL